MPLLTPSRPATDVGAHALPDAASLLLAMHGGLSADLLEIHPLLPIADQLGAQHRRQWAAEDLSRLPGASDAAVAGTKRRIDELNTLRARCVDEIDAWYDDHFTSTNGADVPLHTETVGSVVDRLAIAAVRTSHLATDGACAQLGELAHAYSVLVADLAAGRRRVPSWRTLKAYGTAQ